MKKRIILIVGLFISVVLLSKNIYAKYNFIISMDAFSLNRDVSEILYTIEKSNNTEEYINKDIILKIIFNKKIEPIEGFELDESKKILTKNITQNEEKTFLVKDFSGNQKEVNYSIKNIDKENPQIIGIEDGLTYTEKKDVSYTDNIGIKNIEIERYSDNLEITCMDHYYNAAFYTGLDVLGNQIYVDVTEKPKGTKYYNYYINNELKSSTEKSEYTFTNLNKSTTYTIRIEAIDENKNILDTITRSVKTKSFSSISAQKEGDNFYVKISGIDSRMNVGYCCLWNANSNNQKYSYPVMNSDRSIELSFNAYDVDGTKCSGYYYFHLQLFSTSDSSLDEIVVMNVLFDNSKYIKFDDDNLNPEQLYNSGKYEITVTDLAGNQTKKNCTIKL